MTEHTYSLEEAAGIICGRTSDGHVVPGGVQWLVKRLRGAARPQLPGFKRGRDWRMTESDVEAAIELLRPNRVEIPAVPMVSSMTRTSRRRLAG